MRKAARAPLLVSTRPLAGNACAIGASTVALSEGWLSMIRGYSRLRFKDVRWKSNFLPD